MLGEEGEGSEGGIFELDQDHFLVRVEGSRGKKRDGGFKERPGFKPLFSLVCRCRWNVLCVKKI